MFFSFSEIKMDSWGTLSVEVTSSGASALGSREERGSRRVQRTVNEFVFTINGNCFGACNILDKGMFHLSSL